VLLISGVCGVAVVVGCVVVGSIGSCVAGRSAGGVFDIGVSDGRVVVCCVVSVFGVDDDANGGVCVLVVVVVGGGCVDVDGGVGIAVGVVADDWVAGGVGTAGVGVVIGIVCLCWCCWC